MSEHGDSDPLPPAEDPESSLRASWSIGRLRPWLNRRRLLGTKKRGDGIERSLADALGRTSVRIDEIAEGKEAAPEQAVVDAEQSVLLAGALERLPEDHRRIIQLRHFDGLTHEQIAAKLGRRQAAIRMLWVRALIGLRQAVTELEQDSQP